MDEKKYIEADKLHENIMNGEGTPIMKLFAACCVESTPAADVIDQSALVDYIRKAARNAKKQKEREIPYSTRYYQFKACQHALQFLIYHIKKGDISDG